jgi:hypothetical protein
MKLDMDLVRTILLTLESGWQPPGGAMVNPEIPGYDELTIDHHVHLMWQAGLVDADEDNVFGDSLLKVAKATQLTWAATKRSRRFGMTPSGRRRRRPSQRLAVPRCRFGLKSRPPTSRNNWV